MKSVKFYTVKEKPFKITKRITFFLKIPYNSKSFINLSITFGFLICRFENY